MHVIGPPHAVGFLESHQPPRALTKMNTKEWEEAVAPSDTPSDTQPA